MKRKLVEQTEPRKTRKKGKIVTAQAAGEILILNIFQDRKLLARYCMVYMVLLGTELGLRDGTQISVTAVVDHLHGAAKEVVQVIAKLIVIGFSAIMFYESMGMVMTQISSGQTSASLQIPMAIPYAALPISFGLICVVQIGLLVKLFLPGQSEPAEQKELEEGGSEK